MNYRSLISILLPIIFIIGIWGTGGLVYKEFTTGDICPKILSIPACYIIAMCFLVPFVTHLTNGNNLLYYLGTGLAFSIALYGTISQTLGLTECPKTSSGIPMCYISLLFFTSLIVLKLIHNKLQTNPTSFQ